MNESHELAVLRDPRLSAHVTSALPVWLWSEDASRILWANAAGAAIFGGPAPGDLTRRRFDSRQPAAQQVARLAASLLPGAAPRLERLRGFGAGAGRTLICLCSRIEMPDGSGGILIAAAEPAGPALSLAERVRCIFLGQDEWAAVFAPEGTLLYAGRGAAQHLGPAATLAELGASEIAAQALASGEARGTLACGSVEFERLGIGNATILLAKFEHAPALPAEESAAEVAPSPMTAVDAESETAEPSATVEQATTELRPLVERRYPIRFLWQIDPDGRFTVEPGEFTQLTGHATTTALGRSWKDIAAELALDPEGHVTRAIDSRDAWTALIVSWPIEGTPERLAVELSGIPVFDRDRAFRGYRGYGVCRDVARLAAIHAARRMPFAPPLADIEAPPPASREPSAPEPIAAEPLAAEPAPVSLTESKSRPTPPEPRPLLSIVPAAKNVLPFRPAGATPSERRPVLTPVERDAFHEVAKALGARFENAAQGVDPPLSRRSANEAVPHPAKSAGATAEPVGAPPPADVRKPAPSERPHPRVPVPSAFAPGAVAFGAIAPAASAPAAGPVEPPWPRKDDGADIALKIANAAIRELESILERATDGIIVIDRAGLIHSTNRGADKLFGFQSGELIGRSILDLLVAESRPAARDYLAAIAQGASAQVDEPELEGHDINGAVIPLSVVIAPINGQSERFSVVFRDVSAWKRAEETLTSAMRQAERASSTKSDFLAKISHEIRTPLNAIIGFSEVMMEERFGPIENERYRQYLKDIRLSGEHIISLVNDLLDLSKIEAGKLDLNFASIQLNDTIQQCVALMQPQTSRERIIIRTSLAPGLPTVTADERSIRQIVLNLLSNSVKFTGAGGQVIVSTAVTEHGEVVLRVRDTGVGMSEKDLATALEPFRQVTTSGRFGSGGTGLGLPLTKALALANGASFAIKSAIEAGTLVEITFPASRVDLPQK